MSKVRKHFHKSRQQTLQGGNMSEKVLPNSGKTLEYWFSAYDIDQATKLGSIYLHIKCCGLCDCALRVAYGYT